VDAGPPTTRCSGDGTRVAGRGTEPRPSGMFAAVQGVAAVAGGAVAGELPARSVSALVTVVAVLQVASLALLLGTLRTRPS
jgi:hypothetical protein